MTRHSFLSGRFGRRTLLAGLAAMLPLASIPGAARAQDLDPLTMRLEWTAFVAHLPLHLAVEKGWFKDAGLDVMIEDGNGSTTTVNLVGTGQFDLGHAALSSAAVGAAAGLDVTALASYMAKSPLGIIYAEDAGIETLEDLKGKTVIYTPGSFETPFIEPFFKMNGIDPSDIELVGVEASAKISSYATGNADAFITTVPGDMPHVEEERDSDYFLFADHGLNLPAFGIIANTDSLADKGDAIKRFTSVVSAAWEYILDGHEQEAAEAVMAQRPDAPTSVERLVSEFNLNKPYYAGDGAFPGTMSVEEWATVLEEMKAAGIIDASTDPADYIATTYNDADYGRSIVGQ
ncbi:ABC transporter substrate-binding protein [Chachezhania sediminis]|uniref:ABC transporter substrate-binding protein n=1 Tax=Chachezhania sediminis TaxID=2599291 RepID=UPI00131C6C52|nr:ABC transporter substrate-binding protein [Chachezhania sediminis]